MFGNHKHRIFESRSMSQRGIDGTVARLVDMVEVLRDYDGDRDKEICKINERLKSLEDFKEIVDTLYRDELCSDCCHVDVCAICPSVKYGYECEDKTLPCFLVEEIEQEENCPPVVGSNQEDGE